MENIDISQFSELIDLAIAEDIGAGDVTSENLFPPDLTVRGRYFMKEAGIVAGLPVVKEIFKRIDPGVEVRYLVRDGDKLFSHIPIAEVRGKAISILKGERVSLNFLQRLSGIATIVNKICLFLKGTKTKLLDTRKTVPGMRYLEKYAVRIGGGTNHRLGLYDKVLIKDNHIRIAERRANLATLKEIIETIASRLTQKVEIEIEVADLDQLRDALGGNPDIIMLDNMPLDLIRQARAIVDEVPEERRPKIEISGNVTMDNIGYYTRVGVEYISMGAVTHSVDSLDISLEIEDE